MSDGLASRRLLVLGIDTSGVEGSLALAHVHGNATVELVAAQPLANRQYSSELLPKLSALFLESGADLQAVAAISVVSGPGSFTGLRIGLSAAKALAEAASLPVIAVSRLAMLASLAEKDTAAVLDAGRGEYYLRAANAPHAESLATLAALAGQGGQGSICICEASLAGPLAHLQPLLVPAPGALQAIRVAAPRLLRQQYDDAATLDANYLRRPYQQPASTA